MALIGYARVSTDDGRQTTLRQLDELRAAGCTEVLEEHANGTDRARPVLNRLLAGLEPGTTVCVVKLDRLARSTKDLLDRDRPEPGGPYAGLRNESRAHRSARSVILAKAGRCPSAAPPGSGRSLSALRDPRHG